MKTFIASALMLLAPAFALAQTPAQPAAKPAAKASAKTTTAKAAKTAKAESTSSRTQPRPATDQVAAAGIMTAEAALSPAELAIAERVHVGRIACELGAHVTLKANPHCPATSMWKARASSTAWPLLQPPLAPCAWKTTRAALSGCRLPTNPCSWTKSAVSAWQMNA
jgi:pyruvate/2-oxoglutarate dehydrogenase complex dihydrolipoamide acyltransferase (E2) component